MRINNLKSFHNILSSRIYKWCSVPKYDNIMCTFLTIKQCEKNGSSIYLHLIEQVKQENTKTDILF